MWIRVQVRTGLKCCIQKMWLRGKLSFQNVGGAKVYVLTILNNNNFNLHSFKVRSLLSTMALYTPTVNSLTLPTVVAHAVTFYKYKTYSDCYHAYKFV